jgi:eukaryotic-like serine/threonine-protein kinase
MLPGAPRGVHGERHLEYNPPVFCPVCRSEYADDWKVCPRDTVHLLRSQYVGKYRIDQLLGAGGMGAVYKAYNPDTQSTVAVKLMHGGTATNDAARQRFQREAASVAALTTRHVVSIYDFGSDVDGTLYLVMEYLQGHALRDEIAPMPRAMPLPRINFVIDQALRGLSAAHRTSIVHRDLKPENLFVADTDDGEVVKILDFGIARSQRGDTPNLTHSGALMGTPAYMAPEQVAGNRGQVGRHSDVYAMGVIMYEMVTGISPFHAETLSEVLSRILSRTFTPLTQIRPDLPLAVSQLIDRALADDPASRFGSADALREAWAGAWSQLPIEIRGATVPSFAVRAAAPAVLAPEAGLATELPPAAPPPAVLTPGDHDALAATAAVHPPAAPAHQSMTPGPVVVETEVPGRRPRTGLWVGLAALVVVGGGAAVAMTQMDRGDRTTAPSPGAGPDPGPGPEAQPGPAPGPAAAIAPAAGPPDAAPDAAAAEPRDGMVRFDGGALTMGVAPALARKYPAAEKQHDVTVAPFWLDRTEVTVAAARAAGVDVAGADDLPATRISWDGAAALCAAVGKRLPTAAEWEYAARSAPLDRAGAALLSRTRKGPAAVGTHPGDCTPDGVCDLLGNVMEWTADDWAGKAGHKVVRGASFNVGETAEWHASVHARLPLATGASADEVGVRCAADARP